MPYMADLIKMLQGLGVRDEFKVIVGGGPVSQVWAESIGADGYSDDANAAVELCRTMMESRKAGRGHEVTYEIIDRPGPDGQRPGDG